MKLLCFFVSACLLVASDDDGRPEVVGSGSVRGVVFGAISPVIDFSNMDIVSSEIDRVSDQIQGKQKELERIVYLNNSRKVHSPIAIKRDAKAIVARQKECRKMALQRVDEYDVNAREYGVLQGQKDNISSHMSFLNERVQSLAAVSVAEGAQGLSPEMDGLKVQMIEQFTQYINFNVSQQEKVENAKKLLNVGTLIEEMPLPLRNSSHKSFKFFNRPGNKMMKKLELQKKQEASDRLVAAAGDALPDLQSPLLNAAKALSEQRPAAEAAAAVSASAQAEPVLRRPKGTECLTGEELLRYTTLQKELRPLKRHVKFLSWVLQDLMMREEVRKPKQVHLLASSSIKKAKGGRTISAARAAYLAEDVQLKAHEQAQASIQRRTEKQERREENARRRALKKEQGTDKVLPEAAQAAVVVEPKTLYLPHCVETEAFSKAFEDMNERTQNALEAVISDLMLGGETVRSRGVIQGIVCTVNGTALRIGHADYLGPKDRLFYAIYNSHLVLLQAGSHDFDPKNSVVTL